jgi:hypothetical protein
MKNALLILGMCWMTPGIIKAQENITDVRDRVLFGAKAGLNYSNVYDSQGEGFQANPKVGLAAGVFLALPIGRFIGIQPEALISQKGFSSTGSLLGGNYSMTRTTTYLDIPLLFALKPSEFITLVAGPQYSFLMHQTDAFNNGVTSVLQEQTFENENPRKNILGVTGGIDLTIKHVVLGARAGWDVLNNNGDGTTSTPRYKNVWYQATIGFRIY